MSRKRQLSAIVLLGLIGYLVYPQLAPQASPPTARTRQKAIQEAPPYRSPPSTSLIAVPWPGENKELQATSPPTAASIDVFQGVVLTARETDWKPTSYLWFIQAPDRAWIPTVSEDGGSRVRAAYSDLSQTGRYDVLLVIVGPTGVASQAVGQFEVGGSPTPPLPPDPPDPPDPPPPDALDGIAKEIYDWAMANVAVGDRHFAANLAQSFDAVSSQIAAGTITTPSDIIAKTTASNRSAIGDTGKTAWWNWFVLLQVYLNSESKAGRLVSPSDHVIIWMEIAEGLRAVK